MFFVVLFFFLKSIYLKEFVHPFKKEHVNKTTTLKFVEIIPTESLLLIKNKTCSGNRITVYINNVEKLKEDIENGNEFCGIEFPLEYSLIPNKEYVLYIEPSAIPIEIKIIIDGNKLQNKISQEIFLLSYMDYFLIKKLN